LALIDFCCCTRSLGTVFPRGLLKPIALTLASTYNGAIIDVGQGWTVRLPLAGHPELICAEVGFVA
jgi:hypothetical protein